MTKEAAKAAVETAAWDEYNSALPGYAIWGCGSAGDGGAWAAQRAASHFTYRSAVAETEAIQ